MATSGTLTPAILPTAPAHTPAGREPQVSCAGSCCGPPAGRPGARGFPQVGHSWGPAPEHGWAGERPASASPTCAVDHAGRLDGAVLGLDSRDPPHPKVVCPHTDAGHRAVLDDLGARGVAAPTAAGGPRGVPPTLSPPRPAGPGPTAPPRAGGPQVTARKWGAPRSWELHPHGPRSGDHVPKHSGSFS